MNFYPFHLGDYTAHTAHLEPIEDLAYRRMLDAYYLREGPLPADTAEVARLIRLRQHQQDVEAVLREFFVQCDEGWRHPRCDEELVRMQERQAKAKASAEASVSARRAKAGLALNERSTDVERTLSERSTDAELPIPIPIPIPISKKNTKAAAAAVVRPDEVDETVWSDWLALRRNKRAPVTPTVVDTMRREAAKAGWSLEAAIRECCGRGWQGFKAEWVAGKQQEAGETAYQRAMRQRMAEFAPGVAARSPNASEPPGLVIDATELVQRLEG